jgi:hypothetical protein
MIDNASSSIRARAATLGELRKNVIPLYIAPIPCNGTLRAWFDRDKVPRFKAGVSAKRGGGPVFYSVAAVEKLLRSLAPRVITRTINC